jgi:hypothetical protein
MVASIAKETFGLNKKDFSEKISKIINNHRANSKLIGEPAQFVLRACRLTESWQKNASDPECMVYLRFLDLAGGRRVKMLMLEKGGCKQPVPKAKLIDTLYPPRKTASTASIEQKHFNLVKQAMRRAVDHQLKAFRDAQELPKFCPLTGKHIRQGVRTDVDHVGKSFAELSDSFLLQKNLFSSEIILVGPPTAKRFKDSELWDEWISFHEAHAEFALVHASANRAKGSNGYVTPSELYGSFKAKDPEDLSLDF